MKKIPIIKDNQKIQCLLALGNKARRGKDTVAQYLQDNYGFAVLHWADALYEECRNANIVYTLFQDEDRINHTAVCTINGEKIEDHPLKGKIFRWISKKGILLEYTKNRKTWSYRGMKDKDAELLQWYGTEYRRGVHGSNYWVNIVLKRIDYLVSLKTGGLTRFVIADTRFPNEAQAIKDEGGEAWHIYRENPIEDTGRDPSHISETSLDSWKWDREICNIGSIRDLHLLIDDAMGEIGIFKEPH